MAMRVGGEPFLFFPSTTRKAQLAEAARQAGVPMGELLRRMIGHCCTQGDVLDALVPTMSGQFNLSQDQQRGGA